MHGAVRASALALLLALAGSVLTLATAQQGGPAPAPALTTTETPVVISSPSASAYISGVTALRAAIDSSVPVQSATFFVDGRFEQAAGGTLFASVMASELNHPSANAAPPKRPAPGQNRHSPS